MSPKMTAKDYGKLPKTKVFAGKRYNLSRPLDSKMVAKEIVKEQRSYGGGGRIVKLTPPHKYAVYLSGSRMKGKVQKHM